MTPQLLAIRPWKYRRFARRARNPYAFMGLMVVSMMLLAGCSTLGRIFDFSPHKVKLYSGDLLPDSEISIFRGMSEPQLQYDKAQDVTYCATVITFAIDGRTPNGETVAGYYMYGGQIKHEAVAVAQGTNYDFYITPGAHTIEADVTSWVNAYVKLKNSGVSFSSYRTPKLWMYRIKYDFKKGFRYRVGVRFKTVKRLTFDKIYYTTTAWLQQVNVDGSVVDVAQFEKLQQENKNGTSSEVIFDETWTVAE